jgi:hypothetical protein
MGKTQSKPFVARHGRETAWYVWISLYPSVSRNALQYRCCEEQHIKCSKLSNWLFKFQRQPRHGASPTLISQAQLITNADARGVQRTAASYWQELLSPRVIPVLGTSNLNKKGNVRTMFNITERSRNHCCSGKPIGITHSECMFVALVMQTRKAHARYYFVIWGLSGSTTFSHIISQTVRFSGKKKLLGLKCVFWFSLQVPSEVFLILRITQWDTYIVLTGLVV